MWSYPSTSISLDRRCGVEEELEKGDSPCPQAVSILHWKGVEPVLLQECVSTPITLIMWWPEALVVLHWPLGSTTSISLVNRSQKTLKCPLRLNLDSLSLISAERKVLQSFQSTDMSCRDSKCYSTPFSHWCSIFDAWYLAIFKPPGDLFDLKPWKQMTQRFIKK